MKRNIFILLLSILTACGGSNIPSDVKWKITKEEPNDAFSKDNIEIALNKKVTKEILNEIALQIRKDRQQYDKLWIFYHIPNMAEGLAWATTHFTPELAIEIIGSTDSQDQETSKATDIAGEIVGKWRSEKSLTGGTLILYKNIEKKLIMRMTFKDGSKMESEIKQSIKDDKTRYDDDNKHGEYYILETNGNLGMYGNDGKFDEAIKIE